MISFLLDENIPYSLIAFLEKRGHNVFHVRKLGKAGIRNGEVYQLATELQAWIVTRDKDFRNFVKFLAYDMSGVIVLESDTELTRQQVLMVFDRFLSVFEGRLTQKQLIVIENDHIRVIEE